MVNWGNRRGVKIGEAFGRLMRNPEPLDPAEWGPVRRTVSMEVIEESSIGYVLGDQ